MPVAGVAKGDGAAAVPAADRADGAVADVLPLLEADGDVDRSGDGAADPESDADAEADPDVPRDVGAGSTRSGALVRVSSGSALSRSGFS
ncbi:hypothetical protein [Streptomyces jeddahensis]|uniref:hypothetical protein n=1 Tax=Streptomyces jeddahensis TaxID=1716141 RepID=UPI001E54C303|nr:hypothetical protein [Streptomyces jeddahensis]